ncbi:hypothetical protein DL93DRAFT_339784 [Clavulina sp. PMI_390]|nr:hypothetical protein DL93DRAFT_339784 [Clavulina sp. PMI_390]
MALKPWNEAESAGLTEKFLAETYGVLFEPSDIIDATLAPSIASTIAALPSDALPKSYSDLIDLAMKDIATWEDSERAVFISGHPRIGEVSNLSALSAAEQASKQTPPEVLARLEYLNDQYEKAFPGLRFITFVNGRSRAEIIPEMEGLLGFAPGEEAGVGMNFPGTDEWNGELERAVKDVGLIAKARVKGMGLE